MAFREDFGLRHDDAFVRETFDAPATFPMSRWDVPLSDGETANLTERARLRTLIQDAIDYAAGEAEYGGMWFDQEAGGKANFTFTEGLAVHRDAIGELMPGRADWDVLRVDYTLAELRALGACVGNRHRESLAHARIGHAHQDLPPVRPGHPVGDAPVGP